MQDYNLILDLKEAQTKGIMDAAKQCPTWHGIKGKGYLLEQVKITMEAQARQNDV